MLTDASKYILGATALSLALSIYLFFFTSIYLDFSSCLASFLRLANARGVRVARAPSPDVSQLNQIG